MKKILTLAGNTFQESIKSRTLYAVIAVGLFLLFFSSCMFSGTININERTLTREEVSKFLLGIFYAIISFYSVLICVSLSSGALTGEIEGDTAALVLSKPISRTNFVLGKFFGTSFVSLFIIIFLSIGFWLLLFLRTKELNLRLFLGISVLYLDILCLISLVFFLSMLFHRIASLIFGFLIFFASLILGVEPLKQFFFGEGAGLYKKLIYGFFYYIIPQLQDTFFVGYAVAVNKVQNQNEVFSPFFVLIYFLLMLTVTILLFQRRDI